MRERRDLRQGLSRNQTTAAPIAWVHHNIAPRQSCWLRRTVRNTTESFCQKTRPRSEKDSCSENQIRFRQNPFRFRQNAVLGHPLCRRAVMRTWLTARRSYRFLSFFIFRNPSSARQHSGLNLASLWDGAETEGAAQITPKKNTCIFSNLRFIIRPLTWNLKLPN
jgi:hypothetical protein